MFQNRDMKVLDWILFFILMAIPLVNVIVFLIVLFSSKTSPSLKSYLITLIIMIALAVVSWIAVLGTLIANLDWQ